MISLIRTKILKKQLQLLLVFSKFNRFFNKRLIFPKTNLFLCQFNRFFQKNDLKCSVFSKKNLQMGYVKFISWSSSICLPNCPLSSLVVMIIVGCSVIGISFTFILVSLASNKVKTSLKYASDPIKRET